MEVIAIIDMRGLGTQDTSEQTARILGLMEEKSLKGNLAEEVFGLLSNHSGWKEDIPFVCHFTPVMDDVILKEINQSEEEIEKWKHHPDYKNLKIDLNAQDVFHPIFDRGELYTIEK